FGQINEAEMIEPAERRAVDRARKVGRAIAQHHIPPARAQMREECFEIDDVFPQAEHGDEVGFACGFGRELSLVEVADDRVGIAWHQIAAAIAASERQEALQRHVAATEIENARLLGRRCEVQSKRRCGPMTTCCGCAKAPVRPFHDSAKPIIGPCAKATTPSRLPQHRHEKSVRAGAPRRHQPALVRAQRGLRKILGLVPQRTGRFLRRHHRELRMPRDECANLFV
ncbi:hypothetical protein KXV85_002037, partial [Aspergillus fumigatus]